MSIEMSHMLVPFNFDFSIWVSCPYKMLQLYIFKPHHNWTSGYKDKNNCLNFPNNVKQLQFVTSFGLQLKINIRSIRHIPLDHATFVSSLSSFRPWLPIIIMSVNSINCHPPLEKSILRCFLVQYLQGEPAHRFCSMTQWSMCWIPEHKCSCCFFLVTMEMVGCS